MANNLIQHTESFVQTSSKWDETGHGTNVISVMRKINPAIKFGVFKIFADSDTTTFEALVDALTFAFNNGYRLYNLSLAASNLNVASCFSEITLIGRLLEEINQDGHIFIAAGNDSETEAQYPARFAGEKGKENCFCVSATKNPTGELTKFSSCKAPSMFDLFFCLLLISYF